MADNNEKVQTGGSGVGSAGVLGEQIMAWLSSGLGGQFGTQGGTQGGVTQRQGPTQQWDGRHMRSTGGSNSYGVPGTDPVGRTEGISSVLNSILSPGGESAPQALEASMKNDFNDQVADLRARFTAGGGTSLGTPGAVSEGIARARFAPQATMAQETLRQNRQQIQLQAIMPLLQMLMGFGARGIPQAGESRETGPSGLTQGIQIGSGLIDFGRGGYELYQQYKNRNNGRFGGPTTSNQPTYYGNPFNLDGVDQEGSGWVQNGGFDPTQMEGYQDLRNDLPYGLVYQGEIRR